MDFFSVPRGDCRFLEQNDTRLKGYVEIGVDAEACVFLPDPGDVETGDGSSFHFSLTQMVWI